MGDVWIDFPPIRQERKGNRRGQKKTAPPPRPNLLGSKGKEKASEE